MKIVVKYLGVLVPAAAFVACGPSTVADTGVPDTGTVVTDTGSTPTDTGSVPTDASMDGMVADTGAPGDGAVVDSGAPGEGGVTDTGTAPTDGAAFTAFPPCMNAGDYMTGVTSVTVTGSGTVSSPYAYSPKCLRVTPGTMVMIEASGLHPLVGSTMGTTPNPIPGTTTAPTMATPTVTFPNAGFYPFFCNFHGAPDLSGLAGVIQVAP